MHLDVERDATVKDVKVCKSEANAQGSKFWGSDFRERGGDSMGEEVLLVRREAFSRSTSLFHCFARWTESVKSFFSLTEIAPQSQEVCRACPSGER